MFLLYFTWDHLLPTEVSVLAMACETKHFSKGEIIFRQGDVGDCFMVVEDGEVKVSKDDVIIFFFFTKFLGTLTVKI